MTVIESMSRTVTRSGLCALLLATGVTAGVTVSVEAAADASSEGEPKAAFGSMVAKLEKAISTAKKQVFASEGELKKMAKRAETASWRVAAARERFERYKSEMQTTKAPEKVDQLKGKLENEVRLLKTDAEKLNQLITRSKELRSQLQQLVEPLRSLKDDVAIEADRFDERDRTRKKALQLIADAEWTANKMEEVNGLLEAELESPASETLSKTNVD